MENELNTEEFEEFKSQKTTITLTNDEWSLLSAGLLAGLGNGSFVPASQGMALDLFKRITGEVVTG